jgi:hypothetical protein
MQPPRSSRRRRNKGWRHLDPAGYNTTLRQPRGVSGTTNAADGAAAPAGDRAAGAGEDGAEAAEVQLPQLLIEKSYVFIFFLHRKKIVKNP